LDITLIIAIVGAVIGIVGSVTGIYAVRRDRAKIELSRLPFDEDYLKKKRPDLQLPQVVSDVPLDLSGPFFCLSVMNKGTRPLTVLEAHAVFESEAEGLQYVWHTHWFRSLQALQLFDRNAPCVLEETQPMAKLIFPARESPLLALTITSAGRKYRYYPSRSAHWRYFWRRRKRRRVLHRRLREGDKQIASGASEWRREASSQRMRDT
jgi:hypothetical protein